MYFYENPIVNTVLYAVEITIQRAVLYELGTIFINWAGQIVL